MSAISIRRDDADLPFWSVFDNSRVPMALLDQQWRFVAVNDAIVALYGYSRETLLGTPGDRLAAENQRAQVAPDRDALGAGQLYAERDVVHADGTVMRVQFAAHSIKVGGRDVFLFVVVSARSEGEGGELIAPVDREDRPEPLGPGLTSREKDVLRLLARGKTNNEIATELFVSPETVRSHIRNAMAKTQTHTRAQLVAVTLARHLTTDPPEAD